MTKRQIKAKLLEMLAEHAQRGWQGLRLFWPGELSEKAGSMHRGKIAGVAAELSAELLSRAEKLRIAEDRYQERRKT